MKRIVFIFLFLLSSQVNANILIRLFPYCSYQVIDQIMFNVTHHLELDKERHCAVSCQLALRCPAEEVVVVGLYKELRDIFLPGDPELDDLKADWRGMRFSLRGQAKTDNMCLELCTLKP